MRVLFKYISKLFFGPFFIGLGGFIVFVSVELLYQLSSIIVRNRVGIDKLFVLIYYHLPAFAADGIPVGVLLAIFWTVSTLSQRRELMALQVHGISLKNLFTPFLVISTALSVVVYLLNDFVVPDYYVKAEKYMNEEIFKRPRVESYVVPETVIKYQDKFIYVERYDRKHQVMENVVIIDYSGSGERIMTAKRVYKQGKDWYLVDGKLYTIDDEGRMNLDSTYEKLKLDFDEEIAMILSYPSPRKMSHDELVRAITSSSDRKRSAKWVVELNRRYATSLAPLIIVLTGLSLSLLFNLTSKSWGVILTFVIVVLYQGSSAWLSAMGEELILDPVLAVWLPDVVFGAAGAMFLALVDTTFVQRIRELFLRIGVLVLLVVPVIGGYGYTMNAEKVIVEGERAFFRDGVTVYDATRLIADASEAVYRIPDDVLELRYATIVLESATVNLLRAIVDGKIVYGEDGKGVLTLDDATFSMVSSDFLISDLSTSVIFKAVFSGEGSGYTLVSSPVYFLEIGGKKITDFVGRVKVVREGMTIDMEALGTSDERYAWVSGRMVVESPKGKTTVYFSAGEIEVTPDFVVLKKAYFTTCDATPPHYQLSSEEAFMNHDYIVARNTVLFVSGVPVLYTPLFFQALGEKPLFSLNFGIRKGEMAYGIAYRTEGLGEIELKYLSGENHASFKYTLDTDKGSFELESEEGNLKLVYDLGNVFMEVKSDERSGRYRFVMSSSEGGGKTRILLERSYDGETVTWLLPNVYISGYTFEESGFRIKLYKYRHEGKVSFPSTSTLVDSLPEYEGAGYLKLGVYRGIFPELGSYFSAALNFSYDFSGSVLEDYDLKLKNSIKVLDKKTDGEWFYTQSRETISLNLSFEKDSSAVTLEEVGKNELVITPPFFEFGAGIYRGAEYDLMNNLVQNTVEGELKSWCKFLVPHFTLYIQGSYDFVEEKKWDYPELGAISEWNIGPLYLKGRIKSVYNYDEEIFEPLDIYTKQRLWKITNELYLKYDLKEGKVIGNILDKFEIGDGWKLSSTIKYDTEESRVTYLYLKTFRKEEPYSWSAFAKYQRYEDESRYSLGVVLRSSESDPSVKFSMNVGGSGTDLSSFGVSLSLTKNLHRWRMKLLLDGRLRNGAFEFSSLWISFYISDFPDKEVEYNLLTDEYEVGVM